MKLIVGLGNPGREYEKTRHNIGFMVMDAYASKYGLSFQKDKFNGMAAEHRKDGEHIILLKPLSYMNLSGTVVRKYMDYYKIPLEDILIVVDDLAIPFSNVKLKYKGSSGGHNGLANIEMQLSSRDYKRFKIGIGSKGTEEMKNYVLGKFSKEEQLTINHKMNQYVNILEDFVTMTFENIMNKYNGM